MAAKQLCDERLKYWQDILRKEKDDALKIIRAISEMQRGGAKEESGDLSSYSIHQADQGTDTESMENQVYMLEKQQTKIKSLNEALKRIYQKTFGICEICGKHVPEARLKIIPYARYCIECKAKEEKKRR